MAHFPNKSLSVLRHHASQEMIPQKAPPVYRTKEFTLAVPTGAWPVIKGTAPACSECLVECVNAELRIKEELMNYENDICF